MGDIGPITHYGRIRHTHVHRHTHVYTLRERPLSELSACPNFSFDKSAKGGAELQTAITKMSVNKVFKVIQ